MSTFLWRRPWSTFLSLLSLLHLLFLSSWPLNILPFLLPFPLPLISLFRKPSYLIFLSLPFSSPTISLCHAASWSIFVYLLFRPLTDSQGRSLTLEDDSDEAPGQLPDFFAKTSKGIARTKADGRPASSETTNSGAPRVRQRRPIVNTLWVGLRMISGWIRRICKTIIGCIRVDFLDSFVYDSRWMVDEWVSYNIIMIEGATMSGRFPQLSSVDLLYDVIVDVFRRVINYGAVFGADDVHCDQRNIAATARY